MSGVIEEGDIGFFFFQAEDGIRDLVRSRGLGDVFKGQVSGAPPPPAFLMKYPEPPPHQYWITYRKIVSAAPQICVCKNEITPKPISFCM
mgnify:CR=1 FL=1